MDVRCEALKTLPSSPQARPPVPIAASTAPTQATSPCTSHPDGSMMEFVVNEIPLGLGKKAWVEGGGTARSDGTHTSALRLLRRDG